MEQLDLDDADGKQKPVIESMADRALGLTEAVEGGDCLARGRHCALVNDWRLCRHVDGIVLSQTNGLCAANTGDKCCGRLPTS